jgi:hypothetical protein
MLGDIGHDVDSTVFTAADIDYRTTAFHNGLVRYGLIKTAGAAKGFKVLKVKIAYYAVQNVVSVFNDSVELVPGFKCEAACEKPLAVYGHRARKGGRQIVVFWDKSKVPGNSNDTTPATLKIRGGAFKDPVWVDAVTGNVYEIPPDKVVVENDKVIFRDIPVYDAPAFITDRDVLSIVESEKLIYERKKAGK